MFEKIPVPVKGQPALASWGAGITNRVNELCSMVPSGGLARDGATGTGFAPLPANLRDRKAAALIHPWKVFAFAKSEDRDSCFEIYVPETALHVGEDLLEVGDITPVEDHDDRYTLDCESEISGSAVIYLAVVKYEPEEGEEAQWEAHVVSTLESIEDAVEVLVVLPIAKLSIDASGEYEVGKVDAQYAHSSVAFENPDEEDEAQKTPAPFDIEKVSTEPEEEGEEPVETLSVINCKFNFNGESKTVADYSVPQGASEVWLVGVETNGVWSWRLDTTPEAETSQNVVFNLKLYDLDGLDVEMDYRTTFQTATRGVFKLTGEEGATDGSNPEPLSGNVTISGKAKSGIKFKTTRNDGVKVDIKGRGENDDFAVREVKNSSDQVIAKVFGTAGFKISGGGPDDIDVITGGEFQISGNYLQVKWTKKRIKAVTVEDVTTDWENALTLDEVTVPTDIAYRESTVEFTQKPQTILVPHADPAGEDEVVFEATPHSEETTN